MKVLFIGNSHTYFNDMPRTFADLCERGMKAREGSGTGAGGMRNAGTGAGGMRNAGTGAGEDGEGCTGECEREVERQGTDAYGEVERVDVTMLAYSWKDLEWHASTEYFTARFNILYGGYDYCVIQQGAHPFPGDETTLVNAQRIVELCKKAGTVPILIETWAERDHPEHQENLSRANRMVAEKCGAILAPVGTVWEKIRADHPEIDLFWKDGEHAGMYGDFIIAAVLYRLIGIKEQIECHGSGARTLKELFCDDDLMLRDFAGDIRIDFHHPRVLEDVDEIMVRTDREIVKIICEYVDAAMVSYGNNIVSGKLNSRNQNTSRSVRRADEKNLR